MHRSRVVFIVLCVLVGALGWSSQAAVAAEAPGTEVPAFEARSLPADLAPQSDNPRIIASSGRLIVTGVVQIAGGAGAIAMLYAINRSIPEEDRPPASASAGIVVFAVLAMVSGATFVVVGAHPELTRRRPRLGLGDAGLGLHGAF